MGSVREVVNKYRSIPYRFPKFITIIMSSYRKPVRVTPLELCQQRVHSNSTLEYHTCLCSFDYRAHHHKKYQKNKFRHCQEASEMRRIHNFELYIIVAAIIGVSLILAIAAFCSCKWYAQTKKNPCMCFGFFCCCKKKKKKKKKK